MDVERRLPLLWKYLFGAESGHTIQSNKKYNTFLPVPLLSKLVGLLVVVVPVLTGNAIKPMGTGRWRGIYSAHWYFRDTIITK
jgi:hypothetical protein